MAEPALPPGGDAKRKRQRMILLGAAAVGILLLLYFRSQSAAQAATTSPNATSPLDTQAGGNVPTTFADNGANAAALGDAVTTGLQGVQDALTQLQQQQAPAAAAVPATTQPAPAVNVSVSNVGQPAGAGAGRTQKTAVITTHPGGAFYQWYQRAYGGAPPRTLASSDPRYQAWTHRPPIRATGNTHRLTRSKR